MKTNKKSFAARAKDIINRYKRAKFDKTEREELDAALAALAQEQEAYKQANGIGEYSPENMQAQQMQAQEMQAQQGMQQMGYGGMPKYDGISGTSMLPSSIEAFNSMYTIPNYMGATPQLNASPTLFSSTFNPAERALANYTAPASAAPAITGKSPLTAMSRAQGVLPSIIGGIASGVGNLALSAMTKPVEMQASYTPEQISLARQRERLSREANTAQNIATRGLRGTGSRGAYLAGAGTTAATINRGLSDALGQSFLTEEQINMEQRGKSQDYRNQVKAMNWQARQQANQDKQAYRSAAISTIPSVMTDINRIQSQNALLESLGSQNYAMQPSTGNRVKDILLGRTLYGTLRK